MDEDLLSNRQTERKVYEAVVEAIVDMVNAEYGSDSEARLRIYELVAENFHGMVRSLRPSVEPSIIEEIENG